MLFIMYDLLGSRTMYVSKQFAIEPSLDMFVWFPIYDFYCTNQLLPEKSVIRGAQISEIWT